MIIIIGTKLICSKLSEQIPIMKPKRLNDIQDNKSINSIRKGYSSLISTKKVDVIKIMTPRKNDFVVAAPTKPLCKLCQIDLSNRYNLDCLLVYQMKSTHRWVGNEYLRNHFHKNYKDFFNTITEDRNRLDYKSYDLIISDDNRHSTKTKLWDIYDNRKSNMIGC